MSTALLVNFLKAAVSFRGIVLMSGIVGIAAALTYGKQIQSEMEEVKKIYPDVQEVKKQAVEAARREKTFEMMLRSRDERYERLADEREEKYHRLADEREERREERDERLTEELRRHISEEIEGLRRELIGRLKPVLEYPEEE
ncbi:hypothetical protein C8J57DRAFT_1525404 [Mycena rebaudengoi]|nr:hypothetical protein C8J57DRAFT_1525404 [Mycena rebaudengoi]